MNNSQITLQNENSIQAINYNEDQVKLIKSMYARNATDDELELLLYMSKRYSLDILTKQIWCVKYAGQPAQIYTGRDGFLEIAHRSGQFDGMESGTKGSIKEGNLVGWAKVYRKDMRCPFSVEVEFKEYTTGRNLWAKKPKTMIAKVAESQALRKAFSISGLYCPEEMERWEESAKQNEAETMTENQKTEIWELAKEKGMELQELKKFCLKEEGTFLKLLSHKQAEDLIQKLKEYEAPANENETESVEVEFEEVEKEEVKQDAQS